MDKERKWDEEGEKEPALRKLMRLGRSAPATQYQQNNLYSYRASTNF